MIDYPKRVSKTRPFDSPMFDSSQENTVSGVVLGLPSLSALIYIIAYYIYIIYYIRLSN